VVQMQNQIARIGTIAAGKNEVGRSRRRRNGDLRSHANADDIITALQLGQCIARAGVNGQAGVEVAAKRVHDKLAGDRRGELIPDTVTKTVHAIRHRIAERGSGIV